MLANPFENPARWSIVDAATLDGDRVFEADVAIVGTGAGGGVTAETLANAGLKVVLIEEGPLKTSADFKMMEREAYPQLYQESANRQTKDKAISVLQGRCVGGSTTVNWTSSFRTPKATLAHWREHFGLAAYTEEALAPWFEKMEARLGVTPWAIEPNANNSTLLRGARAVGFSAAVISRNVKQCYNLGYCGMGCPTNAKQSMLVTTIPAALDKGATLIHRARVERLVRKGDRIAWLEAVAMDARNVRPGKAKLKITARHYVLAAGAIGSPAVLLRSDLPDPNKLVGRRTFLHPTNVSAAIMGSRVDAYAGAPQSVYSDHFLDTLAPTGAIGYKLEAPPVHPLLASITLQGFGEEHSTWMKRLPFMQVLIALVRDGFHPQSVGGSVGLKSDNTPVLDYPITDYVWDGMRRAYLSMAEIQFAAGANIVMPLHEEAKPLRSWAEAKTHIGELAMKALRCRVVSAHVMGGCTMAADAKRGVVNGEGRHFHLANLSVHDGSVFPTSIGANPQLSIYGIVARNAAKLAGELGGKPS